jgi:hypothetical protein
MPRTLKQSLSGWTLDVAALCTIPSDFLGIPRPLHANLSYVSN